MTELYFLQFKDNLEEKLHYKIRSVTLRKSEHFPAEATKFPTSPYRVPKYKRDTY